MMRSQRGADAGGIELAPPRVDGGRGPKKVISLTHVRLRGAAVVATLAALAFAGGALGAGSSAKEKKPVAVPGELIVGFKPGVSDAAQAATLAKVGAKQKKKWKQIHANLATVPDSNLARVEKALASDPQVSYVEPNYVVHTLVVPNDPMFSDLWGMQNTGQTGGTAGADIHATQAWDLETGSPNVVIASIDTGVDFTHPDLAPQEWVNPGENCGSSDPTIDCPQRNDNTDNDHDGYVDDWRGWNFIGNNNDPTDDNDHGTHTSGTLGAVGNNGIGVAGVDWNARIMALKFLDSTGNGNDADAISAITYAADHGARVANNSWGGSPNDPALQNAIDYGASKGMLFAAAAGNGDILGNGQNTDTNPQYPSAFASDGIVAVAATDDTDSLASFSNYGSKSVDLGAPGVGVESTTPGNTYQTFDGTSMATPHVSGAAGLVMSHFAGATLYGTKALLIRSVDPIPALAGKSVSGGRLNVFKALSCSNKPEILLSAPASGFGAGIGDTIPIHVIGANCASPAGLGNVSVTVNGAPVTLSAASPDNALYAGSYTVAAAGPLTVTASVTVGGSTMTQTVNGTAAQNYSCQDVSDPWVDVTPGTRLGTASSSDDGFSTLAITFPFTFYGQTYTTAYVSSNGFLTLGSSAGASQPQNAQIPDPGAPNGLISPFWDDLDPSAGGGGVYAGLTGSTGNHVLHLEWYQIPHFDFFGSSQKVTFEVSLYEATGKAVFRYQNTDFGDSDWDFGAHATAGVENTSGTVGRQVAFDQPTLTSGRAVSCTFGPAAPAAPSITTTSLADATNTQAYNQTLAATGGTPPYTWSLASGSLPSGLSLNPSTGAISGTPTASPGSYPFTAQVTDGAAQSATKSLSISVADPLSVSTASLPGGTVGQTYTQSVAATGGKTPYTWSVSSGSLPPGLTLNASTGGVTGTPTSGGTFGFTVQAADSGTPARTATKALSINVVALLTVTTAGLPGGTVGQAYSQSLAATGGTPPYTWSLVSGSLPPGLSLNASNGAISGAPTSTGTFTFTAQVTDGTQNATKSLSITVVAQLAITTASLPGGTVGQAYSQTLAATGGTPPYTWSLASGSLPPGLSLSASGGVVSGTPTTAGTYSFTAQVTDGTRTATTGLSITVASGSALSITTTALPQGRVSTAYSATLAATGGSAPYTWSRVAGALPNGLTLSPSGTISGSPTRQGSYTFTVQVRDSLGAAASKAFTIKINKH